MQSNNEKGLDKIRAIYPQCAKVCTISDHRISLNSMCAMRMQNLKMLFIAMKRADQLLARMDFSIAGAIDQSASMFLGDGEATFEPNFYAS